MSFPAWLRFWVRKARLLPPQWFLPVLTQTLCSNNHSKPAMGQPGWGGCGVGCPHLWAAPGAAPQSVHHCCTQEPLKHAEHRLGLYRLSWRPFPAPGRVGSCSRIKGKAIILPWLTNELKGKSSGLHNMRYSGWERPSGCQRAPSLLRSSDPPQLSRHRQGLCEPRGEHTMTGATYLSTGSGCGLLFPHTGSP